MVKLQPDSTIDANLYPFTYKWDIYVRTNYDQIQYQIDKQTFHNQAIMRSPLYGQASKRDSDIVRLNLLKAKQRIGQLQKGQIDIYQSIDSSIRSKYTESFNVGFGPSLTSGFLSGSLFLGLSYFNIPMAPRFGLAAIPIILSSIYRSRNVASDISSTEFLDWVFNYRRSKSFGQRYKQLFNSQELVKILKDGNLAELGEQMMKSASAPPSS